MKDFHDDPRIGRYADVLMDRQFKRTFGSDKNKRLTELLLQALIPEHCIESIEFVTQELRSSVPLVSQPPLTRPLSGVFRARARRFAVDYFGTETIFPCARNTEQGASQRARRRAGRSLRSKRCR